MEYLFWNRIQEITEVFATKVWSYTVLLLTNQESTYAIEDKPI